MVLFSLCTGTGRLDFVEVKGGSQFTSEHEPLTSRTKRGDGKGRWVAAVKGNMEDEEERKVQQEDTV